MVRRVAAHRVVVDGKVNRMCVIELGSDGFVRSYAPFNEEVPFTEWLGGTITLGRDGLGRLVVENLDNS